MCSWKLEVFAFLSSRTWNLGFLTIGYYTAPYEAALRLMLSKGHTLQLAIC